MPASLRVDLLNPWGRDTPVDFRRGVPAPGAPGHAPVNYWAWPAATGGCFLQTPDAVAGDADAVIVLLRWRGFDNLRAVRQLKARGRRVFVSWKESGSEQIERQLRWPWWRQALRRTLALADGAIATTEPGIAHYVDYGMPAERVHFIPPPYPFDIPTWDFARPVEERAGIVVGTRQFDVVSRRHADALGLAGRIGRAARCSVSVFNFDGAAGRERSRKLVGEGVEMRWLEQRLALPDYLREIARHRLIIQRDEGWVPGQVAGDALLCGLVNIGGNGAVQRLAFPDYAEPEADEATLERSAVHLLGIDTAYREACAEGRRRAARRGLSFATGRERLRQLLATAG